MGYILLGKYIVGVGTYAYTYVRKKCGIAIRLTYDLFKKILDPRRYWLSAMRHIVITITYRFPPSASNPVYDTILPIAIDMSQVHNLRTWSITT